MGVAGIEEAEAAADLMRANIDRKEAAKDPLQAKVKKTSPNS